MLVRESLPEDLPRIEKEKIAEPYRFWALYATSFYERLFEPIQSKKLLKKAYNKKVKELAGNKFAIKALNFFYQIRRDELDGINLWESKLFESPDMIEARNLEKFFPGTHTLDLNDFQVPFGYFKGKMRLGQIKGVHPSIKMVYADMEGVPFNSRKDFHYSGRIWIKEKIISFWDYPETHKALYDVLTDIEHEFYKRFKQPLTINPNEWYIEIIDKRLEGENYGDFFRDWSDAEDAILIPVKDYRGSGEWSEEKKEAEHIKSPLLKTKKTSAGYGSKNPKYKPLAWRQAMYQENLVPSFKDFLEL